MPAEFFREVKGSPSATLVDRRNLTRLGECFEV